MKPCVQLKVLTTLARRISNILSTGSAEISHHSMPPDNHQCTGNLKLKVLVPAFWAWVSTVRNCWNLNGKIELTLKKKQNCKLYLNLACVFTLRSTCASFVSYKTSLYLAVCLFRLASGRASRHGWTNGEHQWRNQWRKHSIQLKQVLSSIISFLCISLKFFNSVFLFSLIELRHLMNPMKMDRMPEFTNFRRVFVPHHGRFTVCWVEQRNGEPIF